MGLSPSDDNLDRIDELTDDAARPRSVGRTVGLLGGAVALAGAPTAALLVGTAGPAAGVGATFTVDSLVDTVATPGNCSTPVVDACNLRDALAAASPGDTIVFAPGLTGTYSIQFGTMSITKSVTITGPGASDLNLGQTGSGRIFDITNGAADVVISGVTMSGAISADKGAAIRARNTGALTLQGVVVSGNTSDGSGGGVAATNGGALTIAQSTFEVNRSSHGWGGGLYVGASGRTITITDSTFSNDASAEGAGGAIAIVGSGNQVTIANSTITDSSADNGGGAIFYDTNTVTIAMCTITGNSTVHGAPGSGYGGGVAIQSNYTRPSDPLGTATIVGTILSGNMSPATPADADLGLSGPATATVRDSILGAASAFTDGGGNIRTSTPGLAALADNGGPTMTMALLAGSPAIDAGPATVPNFPGNSFDQRGTGYDRISNGRSDIGAFEVQVTSPTSSTTSTTESSSGSVVPTFAG